MRLLLYMLAGLSVIGLAYWAYNENYATQAVLKRVETLQREIGAANEKLGVLKAEWAYLNRPQRLRDLVELNYKALRLMPLAADHLGEVEQVAFPKANVGDITKPVDLSAETGVARGEVKK